MQIGTGQGSNNTALEKVGRFFYLINPYTHTYEHIKDVPDIVVDALPVFIAAIIIEIVITSLNKYPNFKFYYMFTNISGGMIQQGFKIAHKPLFLVVYCWVYENYRIYDLPWNSVCTWYLAFLGVDFIYYWFHRATHEINIFWASHQMHHSSEDMNLTTALRQSIVQTYLSTFFYTPMAFFVPPAIFYIHSQFNLIYQFWIHTEVIRNIGPLEYILNTASHHRVHHGRNPYCIDKNYGGTLIIWDRIFNTFAAEDEQVAYGLVHQQTTASPWRLQFDHFIAIAKRCWSMDNWHDKMSVVFRGPGWLSEQEKAGLTEEEMNLPEDYELGLIEHNFLKCYNFEVSASEVEQPIIYREVEYFDIDNDKLESIYVFIHFLTVQFIFKEFFPKRTALSTLEINTVILFVFSTLTSLGFVLEKRRFWCLMECFRCVVFIFVDVYMYLNSYANPIISDTVLYVARLVYIVSIILTFYLGCIQTRKIKKSKSS